LHSLPYVWPLIMSNAFIITAVYKLRSNHSPWLQKGNLDMWLIQRNKELRLPEILKELSASITNLNIT
jgi:hypothetical protein